VVKVLVIIALVTLCVLTGFSYYAGVFDAVELTRESCGPFYLIYREYRGPYQGIRFVMNNVYQYVRDSLHLQTNTGFAVFYDNPGKSDPDSLRSISGIICDSLHSVQPPYRNSVFERTDAVVGEYNLRSFFSYMTGSYKFYPQLHRYIAKKKIKQTGPVIEIYDLAKRSILFIAPVQRSTSPVPPFIGSR
jgi:hypothetical protein